VASDQERGTDPRRCNCRIEFEDLIATAAGALCGLFFLWSAWKTMKGLHSLKADGTIDYANAVGNVGTVYIPIHPGRKGGGQIQVKVQGRERTVLAITDSETEIGNLEKVRIIEKIDQLTVLVAPLLADSNDPIKTNPPGNEEGKE
jgi:hypothetical protein